MMAIEPWLGGIAGLTALLAWVSNFYLLGQYILHPKRRSRFSRESGVWGGGWLLWVVGFVLDQSAPDSHSWAMAVSGDLCIIAGAGCIVYSGVRHWRERTREKRAARQEAQPSSSGEGAWPPPPARP